MSEFKTNRELKNEAKDLLAGRWKDAILLNLVPILVIGVLIFAVIGLLYILFEIFGGPGSMYGNSTYSANSEGGGGGFSGGGLFNGLITTGVMFTFIDWHRNPSMEIRPLKDAFRVFSKKYFLPILFISFLTGFFVMLWTLLFIIPGIVKGLAYSQAPYIYKDLSSNPNVTPPSALECITESRQMMNGHKMRLFLLEFSFIGWGLLSVLTFGIGFIWLVPYINATMAAFYNDLAEKRYNLYQEPEEEVFNDW